ncbi:DUF3500 domain-containing protein [Flavobacterium polysaccharolyticum]|uniref:DUF3500 domain-containing protein n=1 Tax=Flavobacterium polysaccharolyticum TaxID=3133148 RepID=A0ABU9NVN7_9FLAO
MEKSKKLSVILFALLIGFLIYSCTNDSNNSSSTSTSNGNSSTTGSTTSGSSSSVGTIGVSAVVASDPSTCTSLSGIAKLVCLCDQFKASLTTTQQAALQLSYTYANIKTWSNLPASMSARIGLRLGDLTTTQVALAKAIVKQISGTTSNEGYDEVQQLLLADDYLYANGGGSTYGSGNYYLAFFGTPSSTGTFEIMFTGHHKTIQSTFTNGTFVSATPSFAAVEPTTFSANGTSYSPINQERDAFVAILAVLSSTELAMAKSSSTFSDLVCGPTANWSFPTTNSGLVCSGLTSAQKTLVLNAIKTYVNDVDDTNAAAIMATYTSEIDNTYILYSGTSAMTARGDYFRIAGPHVWIEYSAQGGVIVSGVHYHSIWRDRINDYATTKS